MNNAVEIKNLEKKFNNKIIFSNFNYQFKKTLKYALKAPSGYGKSTLLNLIAGFIYPDNGEIFIKNRRITDENIIDLRKNICMLPQLSSSFGNGSVLSTVMQPFSFDANRHINPKQEYITELIVKTGLEKSILNEDFNKLSGGEKQRIGLVICKLLQRDIILLDEPTSALDDESSGKMLDMIFDDDVTIVAASHDHYYLERCNEVIHLQDFQNESD